MEEQLESLFLRQHNQLDEYETRLINQHKKDIVKCIMHVIDCEAYTVSKEKVFLCKISVYRG
jgi:hypothetical protein